jgi:acyl transferase domain-containing protein
MGRQLLQYQIFLDCIEHADQYLKTIGSEWSLMTELLKNEENSIINLPRISQPLCTALQVGLVDLLEHWGVKPQTVVGHSSGEIAAAYALGALTRQDAWKLAFHRGRLTSAIKFLAPNLKGRMMAVALSEETAKPYLSKLKKGTAIVAYINSPENVTISGDDLAILELKDSLAAEGVFAQVLKVENAYHSPHMKFIEKQYLESIRDIKTLETLPGRLMFSSVTGKLISGSEMGPSYWA